MLNLTVNKKNGIKQQALNLKIGYKQYNSLLLNY